MSIQSNRLTRKALSGIVLLVLSLAALGSSGAPLARTQESVPETIDQTGLLAECSTAGSEVGYATQTGKLRFIGTGAGQAIAQPNQLLSAASPEEAARAYLAVCGSLFGLSDQAAELQLLRQTQTEDGRSVLRFQQMIQGVPVYAAQLVVQLDADNDVLMVSGDLSPAAKLDIAPSVQAASARKAAWQNVADETGISSDGLALKEGEPALAIYDPRLIQPVGGEPTLVWLLTVSHAGPPPVRQLVMVDAQSGAIAWSLDLLATVKNRMTYDMNNTTTYPGTLRCDESNPDCTGGDEDEVNAHVYAGDAYDFYWNYHGRDSIDNAGMAMNSRVHYGNGFCTAFWDGNATVYGDKRGIEDCYNVTDDVAGHEFTHGVIEYTSGLIMYYQAGSVNESFSDIWGEWIDLTNGKGDDTPGQRWYIGEDTSKGAIRYMKDPTLFSDPDRMDSPYYYHGANDNGGVHKNIGVGNKAAYLITDGDTFNGYSVTGLGITKAAKIYYEAQTNILTPAANFYMLYLGLYQACNNLIGTSGITADDCTQVRNATLATEMDHNPPPPPPPNDDFDSATVISSLPFTSARNTAGATTAGDDPSFTCSSGRKYHSIWYRYTPGANESLIFETFGSKYDTVLAVWTGSRGSLTPVACNNNAGGGRQSLVSFVASAGVTYNIEVASLYAGGGYLSFNAHGIRPSFDVVSVWTLSPPTIDGIIAPGEWAEAASYDISNPAALPLANAVTLYAMNDGAHLYLAFDSPNDTLANDRDRIGVFFDDNPLPSDHKWTNTKCGHRDGEGNFWVSPNWYSYQEIIAEPFYCLLVRPAPGVMGRMGAGSGHVQAEAAIDLNSSALRAPTKATIGMHLRIFDADADVFPGLWPQTAVFYIPSTFGDLNLASATTPLPPTSVAASDGAFTDKIQITWTASDEAASYKVYRATSATGAKSLAGSAAASPYDDGEATPGVTYTYWVKACNGALCSDFSASDSGWRNLSAPGGAAASDGAYTDKVGISWNTSPGATSYQVFRATSATGTKVGLKPTSATSLNDMGATPGVTYWYWVKACRGATCSDFSASDTGWRNLVPPKNVQASDGTYPDKVRITWTASAGATSYKLYRATSADGTKTLLGSLAGLLANDSSATKGVTYYYWVQACREALCSDFSASDSGWRR